MIHVSSTPNAAGVAVIGDFLDIEALYEALHTVMGDEGEVTQYEGARLRVMGVCYDLRHALMADRGVEFVDNGLDVEMSKRLGIIAPDKNVYYKVEVLWPEVLFAIMVLNDFVLYYAKRQSKASYAPLTDWRTLWDPAITGVRMFQSAVIQCLKETISEASFPRVVKLINSTYPKMDRYVIQYVDLLNVRFLNMDRDRRLKNISVMAKRLAEKNEEYRELEQEVTAAARHHNCAVENIQIDMDYPEDYEW